MHGIIMVWFFLIPSIPTTLGNFFIPMMIGAKDVAFPKLNLLSWYVFMAGGLTTVFAMIRGGVDTGWTFYTPFSDHLLHHVCHRGGVRHLHRRLLLDHDRTEFHRHHSSHARPRHDVVSPAHVHLVALRHQPDPGAGHARARHHAAHDRWWSAFFKWVFSIRRSAAIRSCFSTCSGSIRIRRCTSWFFRRWRWSARSSRHSRGNPCSAITSWPSPA